MTRLLIIDDDAMSLEFMKLFLEAEGYEISAATCLSDAYNSARDAAPDILITDLNLGGGESGMDAIEYVASLNEQVKVIVVSGYDTSTIDDKKIRYDGVITKPVDLNELQALLGKLLHPV